MLLSTPFIHKTKNTTMRSMGFLFLIIGFLTACNNPNTTTNEVEPYQFSKINCYVRYMAINRQLQAEMTFQMDSTTAIEGGVLCNEESMIFKNLPSVGSQYRLIKNGVDLADNYTFTYNERNGTPTKLEFGMGKFENLRIASDGVSIKVGGILEWEGDVLDREDGFVLIFTDSKGSTFSINHTGLSRGTKFEILPAHSSRLAEGPATLQVARKKTLRTEENGTVKLMTIEYYLKPISFEVKA